MAIKRTPGSAAGRSRIVEHDGLVYTVATARAKVPSMRAQTADALARLDENLAAAGTDKSHILTATVFIADIKRKAEMNEAWLAWVDMANPPQRACLGVALEGDDLVEIVVTAAKSR
ncbi:MAG: RidA family protein [Rhodospirillaceae bacterium]|nr:RidA family protein [Rhodospirillaceae bacterium]